MMRYQDKSIDDFLNALSAKQSTPGGGSVVALSACTALSLLLMVARFTLGKKNAEVHENMIQDLVNKADQLKSKLSAKIDDDVQVFEQVMQSYKTKDKNLISNCLKESAQFCYSILEDTMQILCWIKELAPISNPNLDSDLLIAQSIALSCIECAQVNVLVNLKSISQSSFKTDLEHKMKQHHSDAQQISHTIQKIIQNRF